MTDPRAALAEALPPTITAKIEVASWQHKRLAERGVLLVTDSPKQRERIMQSIRGYIEPGPDLDYDHPQGIHVDEAEDIPDFLDRIFAALSGEVTA